MILRAFRGGFLILSALIFSSLPLVSGAAAQGQPKQLSAEDHIRRADKLTVIKDWDGAIAEYRLALRLNPRNDTAHVRLGLVLGAIGDMNGALVEERDALRLNPNNGSAHQALAWCLETKGDWDGALAEEREAVRLNPDATLPMKLSGRHWRGRANWTEQSRRSAKLSDSIRRATWPTKYSAGPSERRAT